MTLSTEQADQIDALIAGAVMGWKIHPRNTAHWMRTGDDSVDYRPVAWTCGQDRFMPTRNLADAWKVVEAIVQPGPRRVHGLPWSSRFAHLFDRERLWACSAAEAALAISIAAMRAAGLSLPVDAATDSLGRAAPSASQNQNPADRAARLRCPECMFLHTLGQRPVGPSPFSDHDCISCCPSCRAVVDAERLCDQTDCSQLAGIGTPLSDGGYRHHCHMHPPANLAANGAPSSEIES